MIDLYTVQIARWRLAKEKGVTLVDTTVKSAPKSGYGFLAPSWDIVMGIKRGEISEDEYTDAYLTMLDESQARYPDQWEALLTLPTIAFACFCSSGQFCHRHLLYNYFHAYAKVRGVALRLCGEITMGPGERQSPLKIRS